MEVSPNSTTQPLNMYDYINSYFMNPMVFTTLVLIIIIIVLISVSLGNSSNQATSGATDLDNDSSMKIYGIVGISLFIVLIIVNGLQYFFGMNIYASIKNIFYGVPEIDIKVIPDQEIINPGSSSIPEIKAIDQVFNIPGNFYGYNDAKALCTAYGSRLATYNEVESAYNSGAEWCNYGWSDGQMALFPTQNKTFDNLQKIKGHEHDCGRPGINGGFIANPNVKFGVNCFGYKPKITNEEDELMKKFSPYPETVQDIAFQQRVDYWKNKVDEILVSPFNYNSWGSSIL